jgi:hypothetical protein
MGKTEIGGGLDERLFVQSSKGKRRMTNPFAIIGPVLQRPRQFFREIHEGVRLPEKIWALSITSVVLLTIYGAMLGSGHVLLSINVAIAVPFLFLSCLASCIAVMYLFDILTGSQRSLAQVVAVLLTSLNAAATMFFCFAPILVVFSLTGTLFQFFALNIGILTMAALVGLMYMVQGIFQTAVVDPNHTLSKVNQRLHFLWMPLFLMVTVQIAWGLLSFHQQSGGLVGLLIRQLSR